MKTIDDTHDPGLRSWVESANAFDSDFPIQNLPFGISRPRTAGLQWRGGVATGDQVFDLAAIDAETGSILDPLAAAARSTWRDLRQSLSHMLCDCGQSAKLEREGLGIEEVAATCGFGSTETMRRCFQQSLGMPPSEYRARFTQPNSAYGTAHQFFPTGRAAAGSVPGDFRTSRDL